MTQNADADRAQPTCIEDHVSPQLNNLNSTFRPPPESTDVSMWMPVEICILAKSSSQAGKSTPMSVIMYWWPLSANTSACGSFKHHSPGSQMPSLFPKPGVSPPCTPGGNSGPRNSKSNTPVCSLT